MGLLCAKIRLALAKLLESFHKLFKKNVPLEGTTISLPKGQRRLQLTSCHDLTCKVLPLTLYNSTNKSFDTLLVHEVEGVEVHV